MTLHPILPKYILVLTLSPGCSSLCWYECACVHTYTLPTETRREGHGTTFKSVRWAYAPRFLSRHNKDLEWRTLKPPRRVTALGSWTDRVIALRSRMDHVIALRQISVTAQCYNSNHLPPHYWHSKECVCLSSYHSISSIKSFAMAEEEPLYSQAVMPVSNFLLCIY